MFLKRSAGGIGGWGRCGVLFIHTKIYFPFFISTFFAYKIFVNISVSVFLSVVFVKNHLFSDKFTALELFFSLACILLLYL